MSKSKKDFIELLATRDYYVRQRSDDPNRDDLSVRRANGLPAEIDNYPYRNAQIPTYIFDQLLREGLLAEGEKEEAGGRIFRPTQKLLKRPRKAA